MKSLPAIIFGLALALQLTACEERKGGDYIAARQAHVDKDYDRAAKLWLVLAHEGDNRGQAMMGRMYLKGQGVRKDINESMRWFRKAAEQGNGFAQDQLGVAYMRGRGTELNNLLAYKWFRLANLNGGYGIGNRLAMEKRMTRPELEQATRMAQEWLDATGR